MAQDNKIELTRTEIDRTTIDSSSGSSLNGQTGGTNLLGGSGSGASSSSSPYNNAPWQSLGFSSLQDWLSWVRNHTDSQGNVLGQDGSVLWNPSWGSGDVDPDLNNKDNDVGVDVSTLQGWANNPDFINGWTPDPSKTNEENIADLQDWLARISSYYQFTPWSGSTWAWSQQPFNFAALLSTVYSSLSAFGPLKDLSDPATVELAEKVSDYAFSFINANFMSALNYQSWYLQQEYNSPVNQVNRLAEAGLNSAFVNGQFSAGNAQSPAGAPQVSQPGMSNAGQAENAAQGNKLGILGSILQAGAGLIPGVGGALASLISAQATKKLSAKQIQLADSEIINNAATYEMLRAQYQEILQNQAYKDFDKQFELSSQSINQAAQRRDSAKLAYDTALHSMGDVEVQGFRTLVRDKSGHTKTVDIDYDEVVDSTKNNGYLKSGDRIVGSESWENLTRQEFDAAVNGEFGFGVPGIGKAKSGASVGTQLEHRGTRSGSDSKEQSKERQDGYETGQQRKQYNQGYDESGRTYRIGESLFTSVTIKRPMSLTANKEYLDKCLRRYESALQEYNTLSTGERARLCDLLDHIQQSLGKFSSRVVHTKYMSRVKSLFDPKVMVGD